VTTCSKLNNEKHKQDIENHRLQERLKSLEAQNANMEKVSLPLAYHDVAFLPLGAHVS